MKKKRSLVIDVTMAHLVSLSLMLVLMFSGSRSQADCPISCKCLANSLICHNANLTVFPDNVSHAENITFVNLAENKLTQIETKYFQTFTNLETLDISNNSIGSVEDGSFKQLRSLRSLDLSNNNLTSLPENSFNGLVNLTKLVLSQNQFADLKKCLNGASGLQILSLSHNAINVVAVDTFEGCDAIEFIDFKGNQLYDIPTKALQKLPNLQTLVLSNNRINQLTDCSIGSLIALKVLQLEDNLIGNISNLAFSSSCQNQGNNPLENSTIQVETSVLQELGLANNHLASLLPESLLHLVNLRTLNLNANNFKIIKYGTFQEMSNIKVISLSFLSELKTVENNSFFNLASLDSLYIDHCPRLTQLELGVFNNVTGLQVIKLNNNGFTTISRELFTWNEKLSIDASGNPFNCDCRLQWIPEMVQNAATSNNTRNSLNNLRCVTPVHLSEILITDLRVKDLRCKPERKSTPARLQTAVIAASVCAVIGILIIVFVKFRNRICIFVKRQFRYKAHRDNRELFSVKLSEIIGENDPDPFYEDSNLDLRLQSLVDTEMK